LAGSLVIAIDPFGRCLKTFDVPVEAAELIPNGLMCFACWLNDSDALYAVEQPIVQQHFCMNSDVVFGVGMVVGHDRDGHILQAPALSDQDIAEAVVDGSARAPFRKDDGYHPRDE
jgi:hypothetical protein